MSIDRLIKYYYKKERIRFIKLFSTKMYDKTILTNAKQNLQHYKGIYFHFDNTHLMHLGDQTFFKPLIKKIKDIGVNVFVKPTSLMSFFFPNDSYVINDYKEWLFVGRTDMLLDLRDKFGSNIDVFLFDTNSSAIQIPVSNYIINQFCAYFNVNQVNKTISASDYTDFLVDKNKFSYLLQYKKIIILNNYVDSGIHRIIGIKKKLLNHLIENKNNAIVVHLGSARDKMKDRMNYIGIVDIDLRGHTTIEDIFSILSLPNVECVYTFDTFTLHVSNFYNKNICLFFKKYFKLGENKQKRLAFSSLFEKNFANIKYLN